MLAQKHIAYKNDMSDLSDVKASALDIQEKSMFESLPSELKYSILLDLSFQDLLRLCQVSSNLRSWCNDWYFWATKAERDFDLPRPLFRFYGMTDPRTRYYEIQRHDHDYSYYARLAARKGNLNLINQIRAKSPRYVSENQILYGAAEGGHMKIVQNLIEKYNFHPDTLTEALVLAIENGKLKLVQTLLSPRSKLFKMRNREYILNNALVLAAKNGHINAVNYLIQQGANDFKSALSAATNLDIIIRLLDVGQEYVKSVLQKAIVDGRLDIVEYIVKNFFGSQPDRFNIGHSLSEVAKNGHFDIVRYLVSIINEIPTRPIR